MTIGKVNIISDYNTAMRFRKLSKFELDLGKKNLKQQGVETVMNISDIFVEFIFKNYGFMIHQIGRYGSISFYYTNHSEANKIYIFFDKNENEVTLPVEENLEEWLSKTLYEIQNKNKNTTDASN